MKFKIGQKVKIIKNESGLKEFKKYIGRVGYIGDIYKGRYDIYPKPNKRGEFMCNWKASELELVKPKTKKEKKVKAGVDLGASVTCTICNKRICFCPGRLPNGDWREPSHKKEGKIERLRYLDKEVISPIIDILEKYDLKTNRGNLLALGRILIFILKKQRELNSLLDAFDSTQEEGKR